MICVCTGPLRVYNIRFSYLCLSQVPDDFVEAAPQILIPQVPGVALTEQDDQDEDDDDDEEYGEEEGEYGEEGETIALNKSIDFSHALV